MDNVTKKDSFNDIKRIFKEGIVDNFSYIVDNSTEIIKKARAENDYFPIQRLRREFNHKQYNTCSVDGPNDTWGIISSRNFFGLTAEFLPEKHTKNNKIDQEKSLFLYLSSGRFAMQKFPMTDGAESDLTYIFPNSINISDILEREPNEQFQELEEFYKMNNREVFEKFGVNVYYENKDIMNLLANSIIMDSLLKNKYSDITEIICEQGHGYETIVRLVDNTEISAVTNDSRRAGASIRISKKGEQAIATFDTLCTNGKRLTNINNLEVENLKYVGDKELIEQLQQAFCEQFKSQQIEIEDENTMNIKTKNDVKKMEDYSIEELEDMLNATLESNKKKEEELKKIELIEKIRKAQEESKELDEQIAQTKSHKKDER